MRRLTTVLILLVFATSFMATACSRRSRTMARAEQLEQQGKTSLALDIYRELSAKTTDRKRQSELNYRIGECLAALDRVNEAFTSYQRAVDLDEHNTKARLRLGELYLQAGEMDRATEQALDVMKSSGASADALALIGAAATANGNTRLAIDAYTRVLSMEPRRVKAAIALAEIYEQNDSADEARKVLQDVAKAQPASSAPWLALGRLEEQEGKISAADVAYRKAVSIEDTPEPNLRLAQFLERCARVDEAEQILQKVDHMRPYFATAGGDFRLNAGDAVSAAQKYDSALRQPMPKKPTTEQKESRAELVSRLIEADLAQADSDDAAVRNAAIAAAHQHLDTYKNDADEATRNLLKAEIAIASDDLVEAALSATAALEKAPDSAAAHYVAGMVRYRSADPAAARAEWESAIERQPAYAPARIALAQQALDQGAYENAEKYIVPVVRHEPGNLRGLILFARALIGTNQYPGALVMAQRVEALAPKNPAAHLLRGEIAVARQSFGEALLEYQQAVLLDTHSREALEGLTRVYGAGHVDRGMLLKMERMGMASPSSATLLEITGRVFLNIGQYNDAERCLREALQIDPKRKSAAEWLARVQAHRGDMQGASESAAQVREFSPMLAGVESEQRQDMDAAVAHYEQAVRSGDATGVAANNLAWIYAQQGRKLDDALRLANRARELQPNNAAVMDTLGFVYLRRREYSQAIGVLETAQRMATTDEKGAGGTLAEVKHHLAEAYMAAGQTERALSIAQNRIR